MSTLMLSQQDGGEGGDPPSEPVADGATPKAPDPKCAEIGCGASCCSPEGIAERATTITPLLAEILTHQATPTLGNVE